MSTSTSRSSRAALPRRFENYTLSRIIDDGAGLTRVADGAMTSLLTTTSGNNEDALTEFVDLGFDFNFDGIVYKKVLVSANGWVILVSPTETSVTSAWQGILGSVSGSSRNESIQTSITGSSTLLAPWFDELGLVSINTTNTLETLNSTKRTRISEGFEPPPFIYNENEQGVKIFYDTKSTEGRRTIIRWSSVTNFEHPLGVLRENKSHLRFESVIYENGKIEFRYAPRNSLRLVDHTYVGNYVDAATVGIFAPGTSRFRDFSYILGVDADKRAGYRYGGAVINSSYNNEAYDYKTTLTLSLPYVWSLRPFSHWPSSDSTGCTLSFEPPRRRAKLLPRVEVQKKFVGHSYTSNRSPIALRDTSFKLFDDRSTKVYLTNPTGTLVNYPTTLQRISGEISRASSKRHHLFTGDFEFTGSIIKNAADDWLNDQYVSDTPIEPWSENNKPELSSGSLSDPFYSGSNIEFFGDSLTYPLRSKTSIRFSLPLNYTTQMFGVSSSIYYYNSRRKAWAIPTNSTYVLENTGSTTPAGSTKGDLAKALDWVVNDTFIEDARGFGPIGNVVSSGSTDGGVGVQSDSFIGKQYTADNAISALGKSYAKSVQINSDYSAIDDETFSVSINKPFILEKAVIEIPVSFGDGWFRDKTTTFKPITSASINNSQILHPFDFAGPGITVSLFNQLNVGDSTRRDLILTGTITHKFDNYKDIVLSNFPPVTSAYQARLTGFPSFGAVPSTVVNPTITPTSQYQFTGTVAVPCTAQITNGIMAIMSRSASTGFSFGSGPMRSGALDMFNSEYLQIRELSSSFRQSVRIGSINPLGRSGVGFDPSGRSIFGKEHVTSQNIIKGVIQNPFYLTGGAGGITFNNIQDLANAGKIPAQFVSAVQNLDWVTFHTMLPLQQTFPSPYLLRPGDKLILALSKMRPFFYGTYHGSGETSGSITHDVKLLSGAINITLWGSMLRENVEFQDTLTQPLRTDVVHDVIGGEPIVDQFEGNYREQYVGGWYDSVLSGSLVTKFLSSTGRTTLVTGSRTLEYSVVESQDYGYPSTGRQSIDSKPYWHRAGTPRVNVAKSTTERYWDSLMPNFVDCLAIDGNALVMITGTTSFLNAAQLDITNNGTIIFDHLTLSGTWSTSLNNKYWTWSYPFESRYAGVSRLETPVGSYTSTKAVDTSSSTGTIIDVSPVNVTGIFIGTMTNPGYRAGSFTFNRELTWLSDYSSDPNSSVLTGSAPPEDMQKLLFGFGDNNTMQYWESSLGIGPEAGLTAGTNHYPDWSHVELDNASSLAIDEIFAAGPIIRGWKHGVYSGNPAWTKAYFRTSHFGHFRDMLEQREFTKFYTSNEIESLPSNVKKGKTTAAVTVKFVDESGRLTNPENTWSQNLSAEATSSVPYLDGVARNRPSIVEDTLNKNVVSLKTNLFGQVTL